MITTDIAYRNLEGDDKLREYAVNKIGELEKYLPRQVRRSAAARILLEEDPSGREDNRFVCEVIISVHGEEMISKEGTVNIYAAVDIVEAKLRSQIRSFKDKHTNQPRRERMISRWLGRRTEPKPEPEATE